MASNSGDSVRGIALAVECRLTSQPAPSLVLGVDESNQIIILGLRPWSSLMGSHLRAYNTVKWSTVFAGEVKSERLFLTVKDQNGAVCCVVRE
jgi:hypothetical protein